MADSISAGQDVDSYCTKCRLILDHIVVAMIGCTVAKVKCKTCGSTHKFKDAPGAMRSSPGKEGRLRKPTVTSEARWESAVGEARGPGLSYDITRAYHAGDLIIHDIFGKGVVKKTFFKKCAVLFRDKERMLATSNT